MREKKRFILVFVCLICFCFNFWADTKKITRIGRHPFVQAKSNRLSADYLKGKYEKRYAADLKYGFETAGNPELYEPFIEQLKAGNFAKKELAPGTVFPWMLFRKGGKVHVEKNVEWAGKKPLAVYSFTVSSNNKNYEFVIPERCGNLALLNVVETTPPLECALTVTPLKANVNENIVVDMSESKSAVSMSVSIYDESQNLVTTVPLTPDAPKSPVQLPQPGSYTFKAKAVGRDGQEVTGPACEANVKINAAPNCKLAVSCQKCKNWVNKPITFDASGSSDSDGEIVKANFKVSDKKGPIESFTVSQKPFTWTYRFAKPGDYVASVTVADDMGAVSGGEASICEVPFTVTQKRLFPLVEGGPGVLRGTFTAMLWARVGILYKIKPDSLDFILSLGGGSTFRSEPWKAFLMGNALLSLHKGNAFFAGGLGFSTKGKASRKGGIDLVGEVGLDVLKGESSVGSILCELRVPVITSDRSFDLHHKWLLGFRYVF